MANGILIYVDGGRYMGGFNYEGLFHGNGVLTYPDGTEDAGLFRNGVFLGE
jgi:hypothetical protein